MADDRNEGVFGSLPRSRPGVRSPARDAAAASRARRRRPDPSGSAGVQTRAEPDGASELEGLARAGVTVASQAASLGFRIAGRAAGALREAVERR